jgi:hypothetical protein
LSKFRAMTANVVGYRVERCTPQDLAIAGGSAYQDKRAYLQKWCFRRLGRDLFRFFSFQEDQVQANKTICVISYLVNLQHFHPLFMSFISLSGLMSDFFWLHRQSHVLFHQPSYAVFTVVVVAARQVPPALLTSTHPPPLALLPAKTLEPAAADLAWMYHNSMNFHLVPKMCCGHTATMLPHLMQSIWQLANSCWHSPRPAAADTLA